MRVAAGEAGAADAEILLRSLAKPRPKIESVFAALWQMRDGLADPRPTSDSKNATQGPTSMEQSDGTARGSTT